MKAKPDMCHLLVNKGNQKVDKKLNSKTNVGDLSKKASREIHSLARNIPYMRFSEMRILHRLFFKILIKVGLSPSKKISFYLLQ